MTLVRILAAVVLWWSLAYIAAAVIGSYFWGTR